MGKSILDNCLLAGPLADRTRILVTHALHVLDKTDYIYVMDDGIVIEQGTYEVNDFFFDYSNIELAFINLGLVGEQCRFCSSHGRTWKLGK